MIDILKIVIVFVIGNEMCANIFLILLHFVYFQKVLLSFVAGGEGSSLTVSRSTTSRENKASSACQVKVDPHWVSSLVSVVRLQGFCLNFKPHHFVSGSAFSKSTRH